LDRFPARPASEFKISLVRIVLSPANHNIRLLGLIFKDIYARLPTTSIILMDDAVSILRESNIGPEGNDLRLYQLQKHLKVLWGKAISDHIPLFIIATTTRPDDISMPDFRRRFDIIRHVGLPDESIRRALWEQEMERKYHYLSQTDLKTLAASSAGMSARDILKLIAHTGRTLRKEVSQATAFIHVSLLKFLNCTMS
jgi:SpoVK/Ycf46/Vps4 family AAA+-type ATPase